MIPLQYGPVPPGILEEEEEESEGEEPSADDDMSESFSSSLRRDPPQSDPWSPSRKRQRTLDWNPPEHVPTFLPPFPSTIEPSSSPHTPRIPLVEPPSAPLDGAGIDKPPTPPPIAPTQPQTIASTSAAASDYLVQVPYSQSSISSVSEWHLPSAPSQPSASSRPEPRWATPATEPALLAAYHHILTHPPPDAAQLANPQRHKVGMALLALTQSSSRWDIPDTLFSSLVTNQPRVASIGPTYPTIIGDHTLADGSKKGADKEFKFPATAPRSVAATERISQLVSQQGSRIPELSRHVLPVRFSFLLCAQSNPHVFSTAHNPIAHKPPNASPAPQPEQQNAHLRRRNTSTMERQQRIIYRRWRSQSYQ